MHIPKTAGSTISSVLRRKYGLHDYFYLTGVMASGVQRFEALPASKRQSIRLFFGHAPLKTGLREADEATLITILRDPVRRVISF